jgi:hypothetical protein
MRCELVHSSPIADPVGNPSLLITNAAAALANKRCRLILSRREDASFQPRCGGPTPFAPKPPPAGGWCRQTRKGQWLPKPHSE